MSGCTGEVLCTIETVDKRIVSALAETSIAHSINTSAYTSFLGESIPIYTTSRSFSMETQMFFTAGSCSTEAKYSPSGDVKESCHHTNSAIFYANLSEGVCLYRQRIFNISFGTSAKGRPVLFRIGAGYQYFCLFVVTPSGKFTETWTLIKNGGSKTLCSTTHPAPYDNRTFCIIGPTPDPYYAKYDPTLNPEQEELNTLGYYNSYEVCAFGSPAPESKTALDGAEVGNMFFPEWCRDRVEDPQWTIAALDMYSACSSGAGCDGLKKQNRVYAENIHYSVLPVGDYVRHPDLGEAYSFILSSDFTTPRVVTSFANITPKEVLDRALQDNGVYNLSGYVLYHPISLI